MTNKINTLKNSNNPNENKLNKLQSDLSNHQSEVHNNTSKRDSALKDIHSRMVSLAELSGKLGQFIGQSDEVTTAINDGIDAIIDSDKDFKSLRKSPSSTVQPPAAVSAGLINDGELSSKIRHYEKEIASLSAEIEQLKKQKTSVPDDLNKSHESHQSKLDALQRLSKLNESFKSLGSNNNDACESLLNNLCSGLEKFLGYQETSKGYDGTGIVYSDLDRLCDGVMSFLHGVLESVKDDESVTTYNKYIKLKNNDDDLHTVLQILQSSIGQGRSVFGAQVEKVSGWLKKYWTQVDTSTFQVTHELDGLRKDLEGKYFSTIHPSQGLGEQLDKWKSTLDKIAGDVTHIENKCVNLLDATLKNKLMHEVRPIEKSVQLLKESAGDGNLDSQARHVDSELRIQRQGIENVIKTGIERVRSELRETFKKVWRGIGDLQSKKEHHLDIISQQLKKASDDLLGDGGVKFDEEYKIKIVGMFTDIKWEISKLHEALNKKKTELVHMLAYAQKEFKGVSHFTVADTKIGGSKGSVEHYFGVLKEKIEKLVVELNGTEEGAEIAQVGFLELIDNGLTNYGMRFDDKFRPAIGDMVNKMMANDGVVHMYLNTSIKSSSQNLTKLKAAIVSQIKKLEPVSSTKINITDNAEDSLSSIQEYLQGYAEAIGMKLGNMMNFIQLVEGDKELVSVPRGTISVSDPHLTKALTTILTAVRSAALRVKEELTEFTTDTSAATSYNLGKDLKSAIGKVKDIGQQFDPARLAAAHGAMIAEAIEKVKPKIKELGEVLDTNGAVGSINGIIKDIRNDIAKLEKLKNDDVNTEGSIEKIRKAAADKMEELKSEIQGILTGIKLNVITSNEILTSAIESLGTTAVEAERDINNAIKQLESQLLEQTEKAFRNVTDQVKKLFAEQHIADLSALHTLVERKLAEVRKIIDEDKVTGIKGLLKSVNGMLFGINKEGMPQFHKPQTTLLDALKTAVPQPAQEPLKAEQYRDKLSQLSEKSKSYLDNLLAYTELQVKFEGHHKSPTKESQLVRSVNVRLDKLLDYLIKINNVDTNRKYTFDHNSTTYLSELNDSISSLSPPTSTASTTRFSSTPSGAA
ncbi:hypothetical protein, conserved [Babesia ovata]|uniref:Extracellular matrix-binding ebh n=1 Tax=Babesia ovata TaxID=189622 RepID=A0A2H6KK96_9APIC|nr:uncharacterized protein BOVATA_049090 [Babesia ovata]GBE63416.1 hypothetical protein, conserved [Babesia ovata]